MPSFPPIAGESEHVTAKFEKLKPADIRKLFSNSWRSL